MATATHGEVALDNTLKDVARDLRVFVTSLQRPRLQDSAWTQRTVHHCQDLAERASALGDRLAGHKDELYDAVVDLRSALHVHAAAIRATTAPGRLLEIRNALVTVYEDFVAHMRAARVKMDDNDGLRDIRIPRLMRSLMHVGVGLACLVAYQVIFTREMILWLAIPAATFFVGLEVSRRFSKRWNDFMMDRLFSRISRPRERYQVNSASYYLSAIVVIAVFTPQPAALVGLLVLAFGDPIASAVGHRWGRHRIYNEKTLEGSAAFLAAAAVVSAVYMTFAVPFVSLTEGLVIALAASLVGTVVELFSDRIDDNFSIPVVTAFFVMLIL